MTEALGPSDGNGWYKEFRPDGYLVLECNNSVFFACFLDRLTELSNVFSPLFLYNRGIR